MGVLDLVCIDRGGQGDVQSADEQYHYQQHSCSVKASHGIRFLRHHHFR
jgi:hypothetical protein